MPSEVGDNLARVMGAWTELFQRGTTDGLAELLDDKVVWNGVFPNEICRGRAEVLGIFGQVLQRPLHLTRVEAEESDDRVAVSVSGPDFDQDDRFPAGTPRSIVFDFRDGHVTRMRSFKTRDEAIRKLRLR